MKLNKSRQRFSLIKMGEKSCYAFKQEDIIIYKKM